MSIAHHPTYGWTATELTAETAEWLAQQPGMTDFNASRKTAFQIKVTVDDIGEYSVDKNGTLTGPHDAELLATIEAQGFGE